VIVPGLRQQKRISWLLLRQASLQLLDFALLSQIMLALLNGIEHEIPNELGGERITNLFPQDLKISFVPFGLPLNDCQ
jgi:hypothetical protein